MAEKSVPERKGFTVLSFYGCWRENCQHCPRSSTITSAQYNTLHITCPVCGTKSPELISRLKYTNMEKGKVIENVYTCINCGQLSQYAFKNKIKLSIL